MKGKKGISTIAIILIVVVVLILIAVGTFLTIWLVQKNNKPKGEVELYEDYVEGEYDEHISIVKQEIPCIA